MFQVHTVSGTVYTVDEDNRKVLRSSDVPLYSPFMEDTLSNEWQTFTSWGIVNRSGYDSLLINYPDGRYSMSTEVMRVTNLDVPGVPQEVPPLFEDYEPSPYDGTYSEA